MSHIEDEIIDHFFYGDEYEGSYPMNKNCESCGSLMVTKNGKYGKFRGCSNFPKCKCAEDYQEHGDIVDNKVERV